MGHKCRGGCYFAFLGVSCRLPSKKLRMDLKLIKNTKKKFFENFSTSLQAVDFDHFENFDQKVENCLYFLKYSFYKKSFVVKSVCND